MDGHVGLSVSEDDAINCVPEGLFTFLNLVYGGQDILTLKIQRVQNKPKSSAFVKT
jgi:hypothetical protein